MFNQDIHISILRKMRQRGGCALSSQEWAAIERTEVQDPTSDLAGTEDWYQASYVWSVVTMAIPIRSQLSATKLKVDWGSVEEKETRIDSLKVRLTIRGQWCFGCF